MPPAKISDKSELFHQNGCLSLAEFFRCGFSYPEDGVHTPGSDDAHLLVDVISKSTYMQNGPFVGAQAEDALRADFKIQVARILQNHVGASLEDGKILYSELPRVRGQIRAPGDGGRVHRPVFQGCRGWWSC